MATADEKVTKFGSHEVNREEVGKSPTPFEKGKSAERPNTQSHGTKDSLPEVYVSRVAKGRCYGGTVSEPRTAQAIIIQGGVPYRPLLF